METIPATDSWQCQRDAHAVSGEPWVILIENGPRASWSNSKLAGELGLVVDDDASLTMKEENEMHAKPSLKANTNRKPIDEPVRRAAKLHKHFRTNMHCVCAS